jgi:mono/diheme cytochrome c family protein
VRVLGPAAAAVIVLASVAARAQDTGNAQEGLVYAKKVCTECHAVEAADYASPNADAPSFEAVANTVGITPRALTVWLQTSHPTMPNLVIEPDDRDNVISYIMTLKAPRP